MEDIENKSTGVAGRILSLIKGAPKGTGDIADVDRGREDSIGGTGEENAEEKINHFPIALISPGGDIFKPYGIAAEDFQREIALSDADISLGDVMSKGLKFGEVKLRDLTIVKMTVPSVDAPEIHITPYCGFPVIKGKTFSVLLNNGVLITA